MGEEYLGESFDPEEDDEEEDEEEYDEDDLLEEAVDAFQTLIDVIDEIGPANTLNAVGQYLDNMDPAYAKIAQETLKLADRCARRHNIIWDVRQRRSKNEGEVTDDGETVNPTG